MWINQQAFTVYGLLVVVENESSSLADDTFTPCAVLNFTTNRPKSLTVEDKEIYKEFLSLDELTIYLPAE